MVIEDDDIGVSDSSSVIKTPYPALVEPKRPRPPFATTPTARLKPTIAASLKNQLAKNPLKAKDETQIQGDTAVKVGESCKNGGCKKVSQTLSISSSEKDIFSVLSDVHGRRQRF